MIRLLFAIALGLVHSPPLVDSYYAYVPKRAPAASTASRAARPS